MKKRPRNMFMLPREIRIRLVIAYSLIAVIPFLATIYFVTIYLADIQIQVHFIKLTLLAGSKRCPPEYTQFNPESYFSSNLKDAVGSNILYQRTWVEGIAPYSCSR